MRRAKTADLKNNLSRYLSYVKAGGEVIVLDRDRPIARLLPFVPDDSKASPGKDRGDAVPRARLVDLERQGVIARGKPEGVRDWLKNYRPVKLPRETGSVLDALLEMRDEERL
jgi:antitoxin (DNA-binding transcriptional repressor) of toxin-antitoxin stability system